MPYISKALQIQFPGAGARPGIGGPMINPRSPGFRVGLSMPGAMAARQAAYGFRGGRGDPGIFGAIGKALGSVAKGVGKAAFGVVKGAVAATPLGSAIIGGINAVGGGGRIGAPQSRTGINSGTWQPPVILPPIQGDFTDPNAMPEVSGYTGGGTAVALCNTKGFHLNRKGYWKDDGPLLPGAHWVPAGSACVKNRRMNPFNPRAASRAMRRLASLSKGMKSLNKQLQKVARGTGAGRSYGGKSKACGCKGRR